MDVANRIERALDEVVATASRDRCPPLLASAVRYAVFPGGARIRPTLCLAVASACGETCPPASDAAAVALELLHCASLVHDDLPCFDDADVRRGKPSVHRQFGQPIAVLTGDALIVLAFEALARGMATRPDRLAPTLAILGGAVGMAGGLVAGQAWESEPSVPLQTYQEAKTAALFVAAAMAGAVTTGADPEPWREFGLRLGEAFQAADDIRDFCSSEAEMGKPAGRDAALERPSVIRALGFREAVRRQEDLMQEAVGAVPACPGRAVLQSLVSAQSRLLLPRAAGLVAA